MTTPPPAAVATRQASDTTVAISEHTHAAGEFANAARHTTSVEALRTLKLLEDHHRRLAALLKLPPQSAPSAGLVGDLVLAAAPRLWPCPRRRGSGERKVAAALGKGSPCCRRRREWRRAAQGRSRERPAATVSGRSQPHRFAPRDMSSSIASNLASARGIRSKYRGQPLSPSVSSDQAPGNVDPHPRRDGSSLRMQSIIDQRGKPTWSRESSPRVDAESATVDEGGYARFYSTFGSLITKISAPLAFAGLPLIHEESSLMSESALTSDASCPASPAPSSPRRKSNRPPSSHCQDPDLSKIYSKATMKALAGTATPRATPFTWVPTSGHTMSYANILSYAEKEKTGVSGRRPTASSWKTTTTTLSTREKPPSPCPPATTRRRAARAQGERELRNNIEELSLENKSLKDMLDIVSKRLHVFEASSQHSAMALAESYPLHAARLARRATPRRQEHGRGAEEKGPGRRGAAGGGGEADGAARKGQPQDAEDARQSTARSGRRSRPGPRPVGGAQVGESVEDARQS
ncbi:hypothetical protein G6O67_000947 [Ophiocordyceps sinensis]|uniref:Uncharacterized protein n=1 Tax=Ophiocordyceps sinensis TaxID=72228 RepID=A0A8H4Q083_9HYPO|nr:hypothetical protein G6O67_000947 [Ophiocordyceps sinensis]